MQDFANVGNLENRRLALRLPVGDLCRDACMNPSTWERARKGADIGVRRVTKAAQVIAAEEHRLLEHLIRLHPARAEELLSGSQQSGAATAAETSEAAA